MAKITQEKLPSYPKQKHDAPDIAKRFGYPMNPQTPDDAVVATGGKSSPSPAVPKELFKKGK